MKDCWGACRVDIHAASIIMMYMYRAELVTITVVVKKVHASTAGLGSESLPEITLRLSCKTVLGIARIFELL